MLCVLIILTIGFLFYYLLIKPQLYWKSKNVKQGPPIPIFGDSLKIIFKQESMSDFGIRVYERFPNERYSGIYQTVFPGLVIRVPDLIKQISVKDFDHFVDRVVLSNAEDIDPIFSKALLFLKGEEWRDMRSILSPTFTGTKMRLMFDLMNNSAKQYVDFFVEQKQAVIEHELKESFTRFANDVIASCAFGVTVDSLKDPENEFFKHSQALTNNNNTSAMISGFLIMITPKLASFLRLSIFPKRTTEFFQNLVKNSVQLREEQKIIRPDMINLLMEARKGKLSQEEEKQNNETLNSLKETEKLSRHHVLSEKEMTAQVLLFFFAGFETVSNAANFFCYNLALNPDIQAKLYKEVSDTIKENNEKLTYDILNRMKYLDMCLSESLRKNPSVPFLNRTCTKEYTIHPKQAGEQAVHLRKGDMCLLPVVGIHNDEKYYENPQKFDPERFSEEKKGNINPYTYMPFGAGPRNCIASRFALMEVKTLIFHILSKFELVVIDKTPIPFKYDPKLMNPAILGGCWIGYKRREN